MADQTLPQPTRRYETCADTAKRVRAALAAEFPGVKFSVRSSVYSGGASIRIKWTDGPRRKPVERIAAGFAGATFDGMDDSMHYHDAHLPDGTAFRSGANFVFCDRTITNWEAAVPVAQAMIEARCKIEHGKFGSYDRVEDLARGMVWDRDADGSLEGAFRRVVLRESDATEAK